MKKKDKWVVAKRPDNCISWASRHLEKAGIVLPTNVSDFLIKLPILFTNQPENEGYCNNISINNIYILGCTIL